MDNKSFEMNKIVSALILAGVVAMVAGFAAQALYTGSIETEKKAEKEEKRGYTIAGAENADAGAGAAPAAEEKPVDIKEFIAKADPVAGEQQVKKCQACHTFDKGGKNGVGPNQWGLVGGPVAHKEDFNYSDAVKALHGTKTWDEQSLSDFLTNPKKYIPGNKMSFAGIKAPQDRANLIAYLKTLK